MANLKTTTINGQLIETAGIGAISGLTLTVDLATDNYFECDMVNHSGPTPRVISTFTINNAHASQVSSFTLIIIQDSPPRQFDWSTLSAFKWPGGTGPTLTTAVQNKLDILEFTTWDAGTSWYGKVVGQRFDFE